VRHSARSDVDVTDTADTLFTDTVDWELIEADWQDLLQVVLSVKAGVVSSALLLRKLGTYSRRNRLYQAFAELGRVIRTGFLLDYLSSAQLREQITATTNKVEAPASAKWLFFGGEGLLLEIHPDEQEKRLKYNHLLTNAVAIQKVIDVTRAVRALLAEGYPAKHEGLATLSPDQTRHIKRSGDYVFTVTAPEPFDGELARLVPDDSRSRPRKRLVAYFCGYLGYTPSRPRSWTRLIGQPLRSDSGRRVGVVVSLVAVCNVRRTLSFKPDTLGGSRQHGGVERYAHVLRPPRAPI